MRRYRFDAELLFSGYAESGEERILADGLDEGKRAKIAAVLEACGLIAYGSLERTVTYSSGQDLKVEAALLPRDARSRRSALQATGPMPRGPRLGS
jgi:hypothetical protein